MKQRIQDHVFFWDGKRKRTFYAYEMPALWFRDTFLDSFWATSSAPGMPWNTSWNAKAPLLMKAMEEYRVEHDIAPYNFHNKREFLWFISGLYTHQTELELKVHLRICINICIYIRNEWVNLELLFLVASANQCWCYCSSDTSPSAFGLKSGRWSGCHGCGQPVRYFVRPFHFRSSIFFCFSRWKIYKQVLVTGNKKIAMVGLELQHC